MTQPRYAIIGTGALGGFYGARLQRAGCDVHFLVHTDFEHVRRHGLICESKDGDFTLPRVNAYRAAREMPPCDFVLVALKTTQNQLLPDLLPPVTKADGAVVMMQNGLGVEAEAARIVGAARVLGGLCFLCANKIGPGRIRHLDYGYVKFAEFACGGVTDRMRQLGADFERAGIAIQLNEDLLLARWQKLVWNIPYNGLSVILNATTAELMANDHARPLVAAVMHEVAAAAAGCGRVIDEPFIQRMLADTAKMIPYRTSMKIDFDERRPMEVEAIYGAPVRAAHEAGVTVSLLEMLYRQLTFLDARRAAANR